MRKLLVCTLLLILPISALAWNEKDPMVSARLAWRQLTKAQRDQGLAILKKHPNYQDYLAAVLLCLGLDPRRLDMPGRTRLEIDHGSLIPRILK